MIKRTKHVFPSLRLCADFLSREGAQLADQYFRGKVPVNRCSQKISISVKEVVLYVFFALFFWKNLIPKKPDLKKPVPEKPDPKLLSQVFLVEICHWAPWTLYFAVQNLRKFKEEIFVIIIRWWWDIDDEQLLILLKSKYYTNLIKIFWIYIV